MDNLTPKHTVEELDKYIVGQDNAKKAVAIALRNRWRRQRLPDDLKEEVLPKNIIMIGPTGVGKTEVARRLARLTNAPFVKVEASKFTEVGYVGRDVESIVRDLVEISMNMVKAEQLQKVQKRAQEHAEERVLDLLLPKKRVVGSLSGEEVEDDAYNQTREKLRVQLRDGKMDDRFVEIDVKEKHMPFGLISGAGMEDLEINLKEMLGNILPDKPKRRKVKVPEAIGILMDEEASRLIDMEKVTREAVERAEQLGLVFIDEIDKVAGKNGSQGPDVSREGVQRDLLPIVEGSTVSTKHGPVRTEHVLFIAAGAFHTAKPSDLIPELQGRFPIRVELDHLGKDEFVRILKEPDNSLTKQYTALLDTEDVTVNFSDDAIDEIASIAAIVNEKSENIGARRLQTVMEKLLEEVSFHAPDMKGTTVDVDREMVIQRLSEIVKDEDLSKYIL
jgi:ATP-dependent HslUV protease ATP-binding subunit HslU